MSERIAVTIWASHFWPAPGAARSGPNDCTVWLSRRSNHEQRVGGNVLVGDPLDGGDVKAEAVEQMHQRFQAADRCERRSDAPAYAEPLPELVVFDAAMAT